jgi:hypothetical protein
MQGYSKGSKGPFLSVHYDSYVEASNEGYSKRSKGSKGPSYRTITMAK